MLGCGFSGRRAARDLALGEGAGRIAVVRLGLRLTHLVGLASGAQLLGNAPGLGFALGRHRLQACRFLGLGARIRQSGGFLGGRGRGKAVSRLGAAVILGDPLVGGGFCCGGSLPFGYLRLPLCLGHAAGFLGLEGGRLDGFLRLQFRDLLLGRIGGCPSRLQLHPPGFGLGPGTREHVSFFGLLALGLFLPTLGLSPAFGLGRPLDRRWIGLIGFSGELFGDRLGRLALRLALGR